MLRTYAPILLVFGFVIANAAMMLGMSAMMSPRRPTPAKDTPYESGMPVVGTARARFGVKFYLVAMLFIVFDIETVFLIPWAVAFRQLGLLGLVEISVFLLVLVVGYVYAWRRGALDWE